ncbi:carotenoid oxygenase [Corynespora cassiicola Philippines]|uniref:Carotenoid oxygenase n=1 Tax=Corynespora cassiicola Philippines TaxID=1448308 RepID=A0A2T2P9B8_CORCC|nr:carotenoid oxygenase [Corynespora cassiicola Philippines]
MEAGMNTWPNDAGFDADYEEHSPVALTVKGTIPRFAAGVLYRTGPLGYKIKTGKGNTWAAKHWFDGFSCVHRFQIDFPQEAGPAHVSYRSRRTVDEYLEIVRKTGKLDSITFGAKRDPCQSFFKKVMSIFTASHNTKNVGVTLSINMPGGNFNDQNEKIPEINGHSNDIQTLYAKTDSTMLKAIDPETLEPIGIASQAQLHPDLKGPFSAAHAKSDPLTGDVYNFNLNLGSSSTYRIFRTSASTGKTDILATFLGKPAYLHSLFITESYVILCVWNSQITWSGISILYNKNIVDAIAPFDPSKKAIWYVVDRKHNKGLVATYESDPFFCFHTINAWEESSAQSPEKTDIVAELCTYDNTDVLHRFYYDNLLSTSEASKDYFGRKREVCLPNWAQYRLASVNGNMSPTRRLPAELVHKADKALSMELPIINPSYFTHKHRFIYGVSDRLKSTFVDGIVKYDNHTHRAIFWDTDGHTPGEPIFVANPKGTQEDDGVLLTVVLDGFKEKSYLLVLDARDLSEMGRAEMDGPMSFGFHGTYKAYERDYSGDY